MKPSRLRNAILFFVVCVLVLSSLPWSTWIEGRIKSWLEGQGYQNPLLTVSHLGFDGVELSTISIGKEKPLLLNKVTLGYSWDLLWTGSVRDITVSGLALEMRDTGKQWVFSGIAPAEKAQPGQPLTIPVTEGVLATLPFQSVVLEKGHLYIDAKQGKIDIPLDIKLVKQPAPILAYNATGIVIRANDITLSSGEALASLTLKPAEKKWDGEWHIKDIKMTGLGQDVPLLNGKGTITAWEDRMTVEGQFTSEDKTYNSSFKLEYLLNEPKKSQLHVVECGMPWNGGVISARDVNVPFGEKKDLNVNVKVLRVSLNDMLRQLTGKETTATGAISGDLPIILAANGTIIVQAGKLGAEEPGVIAMPPDSIPGDNPQVALARDVLKNFQYSLLSINVDQDKDNKLSILMNLEGKNPDVYEGRPVKLNVHLTGDVLNFVQQNLLMLTNPSTLLQQGSDAKH